MLMADCILSGFTSGVLPMHAAGYSELARWVTESFRSMESGALRSLRDVAPVELQEIIENVLQERHVVSWASDDMVGLSSWAESLSLLARCRIGAPRSV